ncbi:MAG: helix-turn-helix domain-containing protein [Nitrososphaerota archaeon]
MISQEQVEKMDIDLNTLIIFSVLFTVQTIVYTVLLLRLKKKINDLSETSQRSQISQEISEEQLTEEKINESVKKALEVISSGSMSAREVSIKLGLSREHTARLLKRMVDTGLVVREGKPFKYKLTPLGYSLITNKKNEARNS